MKKPFLTELLVTGSLTAPDYNPNSSACYSKIRKRRAWWQGGTCPQPQSLGGRLGGQQLKVILSRPARRFCLPRPKTKTSKQKSTKGLNILARPLISYCIHLHTLYCDYIIATPTHVQSSHTLHYHLNEYV